MLSETIQNLLKRKENQSFSKRYVDKLNKHYIKANKSLKTNVLKTTKMDNLSDDHNHQSLAWSLLRRIHHRGV